MALMRKKKGMSIDGPLGELMCKLHGHQWYVAAEEKKIKKSVIVWNCICLAS